MEEARKAKYFDEIFEIFSNGKEGHYTFWADYTKDEVYWSKDMIEKFELPGQLMKNEHALETWMSFIHADDLEKYTVEVNRMFTEGDGKFDVTYRIRTRDGSYATVTTIGTLVRDEAGEPDFFCGTVVNHMITDVVDPTTGLFNRDKLHDDMRSKADSGKAFYLVIIGLRNFFSINSAYGYVTGNHVLASVADYARKVCGRKGMAYRIDGAKIVFLLDAGEFAEADVNRMFADLRRYLSKDLTVDGHPMSIEVCGGAVYSDDHDIDANAVYNSAQFAITSAKESNSSKLCFYNNKMLSASRDHIKTLSIIRKSINEDFKGFFLCYQPIVDAASERLVGMEALLRWKDEAGNIVPPNEFIPWLEQDPIFFELGGWIIRQSIEASWQLIEWKPDFITNINLAYPQLQRDDFDSKLDEIIKETGFPGRNLKLELTERCKLLDMDMLRNQMIFFKSNGMQTALDDFGTGYSALNLLINLPVDQIKIDKSFIDDIESDIPKQSLLRAITTCARELGKNICIEGIETRELMDFLRSHFPVTSFQGYYFSKPIPIDEFMTWAKEYENNR